MGTGCDEYRNFGGYGSDSSAGVDLAGCYFGVSERVEVGEGDGIDQGDGTTVGKQPGFDSSFGNQHRGGIAKPGLITNRENSVNLSASWV